ncbi:hypothetical protein BSL78_02024 [Apostichopus japonicus]|uniref:EGF-like domain-containing protein n=1 Tax=Stichopus japonicus TaxID=307972 RepID=A0A2G8LL97_STIJA|nr:hypothetical protein BSL78_02024 [Apostichopus japonicus]
MIRSRVFIIFLFFVLLTAGRFVARAATPDDTACPDGATFDLMYTEAESHFYIATQNFNSGGYTSDTGSCNIVITGPLNSEIIIIFRTFDLSPGGNIILTGGLGIDRIGRIGGTEPTFPYSDGSTMRNFGILDREILITANRLVINFRNDDAGSGDGVAFEVRLVDNRCGMCLNGGFCDSCSCASGYYGNRCQNTIEITVTSTTSQTRDEGESIEIMCSSNRGFTDQTEVVFALDPASTAVEGLDIPFLAGYPCTFLANRATASVTIPTIDDDFMEGQEDLILVVSEVTGGGHPSAADSSPPLVFSINADSDSFLVPIEFANSLYDVSEGAGSVTVTIEFKFLNQPLPIPEDGSISFTYTPGSATSGNDFTEVTTVNFVKSTSPVTTSVELVIPIIDDDTVESTETFEVQMTISSTVLTLGTTSAITIRILDNDVIDNVVIVDYPNIKKASATEVHLFAFSNQNQAVVFEKLNSAAPETTDNPLVLCGSSFGRTTSLPLPTRSPARRLGRYRVTFDGDSNNAIYAFVSPDSGCLNSDETTITVYPESFGSTFLDSVLVFGLQTVASCTTQIKWQRIGGPISNTGRTHRISRTEDADGTYIITRRNRASSGWFEIIDVILSRKF